MLASLTQKKKMENSLLLHQGEGGEHQERRGSSLLSRPISEGGRRKEKLSQISVREERRCTPSYSTSAPRRCSLGPEKNEKGGKEVQISFHCNYPVGGKRGGVKKHAHS